MKIHNMFIRTIKFVAVFIVCTFSKSIQIGTDGEGDHSSSSLRRSPSFNSMLSSAPPQTPEHSTTDVLDKFSAMSINSHQSHHKEASSYHAGRSNSFNQQQSFTFKHSGKAPSSAKLIRYGKIRSSKEQGYTPYARPKKASR